MTQADAGKQNDCKEKILTTLIERPTIAVIGAGSMAGAVASAMLASEMLDREGETVLRATTRTSRPPWAVEHSGVELMVGNRDDGVNRRAVEGASVVMLGVLPDQVEAAAVEIAPYVSDGAVVMSIAAGGSIARLEEIFPDHVGIVRVMPNLPVDVGEGVLGLISSARTTKAQLYLVKELLAAAGTVVVVDDEAQFDLFTALPGVGPAYVSYVLEAMIEGIVVHGLPRPAAEQIAHAIVRGSVARLDATDGDAAAVRRGMAQPGNVTDASMRVLDERGVSNAIVEAMRAGVARANEFSAE